ncbi:BAG family molecular chaperone regulator 6-like isoform X4 [Miscanthus floridulus]|uniref:BAG family molecular chaperone regulator 6-like isoform X4 n=1 Tax=Miscanthus floridulus TaxID=154761 RepID=UPI00345ACB88
MYPANHYMDPYQSHYRNHAPYPYYPPPRWEIPSDHPRAMDSSYYYRPPSCGTWPYNHDMHHSHPSEFHCCCNRTYPPDYYSFRPPFPQELPPPHLYYHGPFPQHPNACPSYFVPSHPYPVDHTPYGYDKFKSHCCGCPNHVCSGAEKSNVKIEEERPNVKLESEHKNADSGSIIQHPNSKYPFIWLPSGNIKGKENGEHYELSPQILNEWAPENSKRLGDVKQQEQDNQKGKQFQWPVVWMPAGYDAPKRKAKEMNDTEETPKSPKISEEAPQSPKINIIPLSWFENGHHRDQKPAARNGSGGRSAVKDQPVVTDQDSMTLEGNPKTTPAVPKSANDEKKPLRENCKTTPVVPEKEINEKKASTYRTIPVMKENDEKKIGMREKKETKEANSAEKVEENRKTKHSDSSIAKHSKLPPVCLRVDPLPRKKSGNGSSRSPSPPTRKDAGNAKDMKDARSQNLEPKQSGTSNHITVSEVKEKSPYEMKKEIGFSNETEQAAAVEHSQKEEVPTSKDDQKVQAGSTIVGAQENTGAKSIQGGDVQENAGAGSLNGCDKSKNEDGTVIESEAAKDDASTYRVNLSEPDAAVRIQSAYRGYDVRRWQPLDKLRKIRHVHEQMQGVKKQLQCLEDSCNKPTQKEQVAIGETIMNLLLKLDTIQGLHPSVREARKSVARELICLQERLDTLCRAPSGELDHTNSNDDESERTESIIQTAAPTVTTEASDRKSQQERAVEMGKVEEPSSVTMEPCNAVPSGVSWEVRPDADSSEEKNEKQESCSTTVDEAHEEVASSMDMISDEAFTEHPTDNQEHGIGESNVNSVEQVTEEEKPAAEDEVKESSLVNSTAPLYDTASSGDSSGLKQYTASTDQNLYAESNTGFSPASTEDIDISALTASVESELATEKDGPVDSQVHETAALENVELKDDVSSAENEHNKSSSPVVHLEDPLVPLKDVEQHGLTPAKNFVVSETEGQQEARDISLQVQAVDSIEDSGKVPDGTTEASTNDDLELDTSADVEKHDQPTMLEPRLESISAPLLTVLDESDDETQCGVSDKDEVPHVDEKTETSVDKVTGGSANCEDPLFEASMKEPDIQESHPSHGEEADDTIGETIFPDSDSCELSCPHDGGITVCEGHEMKVSSENQTDAQKENIHSDVSETDECTKTQKAAPVGMEGEISAEDSDVRVSEMDKCNEMLKEAPAHATGANPAEDEASLKEDITVQTENKASATPSPDDPKANDEKKLAEENQKLKELLQKLLASGNDQMGVITDLGEKVKALERKLARKKRPKVRVHRPSRHATAKVH